MPFRMLLKAPTSISIKKKCKWINFDPLRLEKTQAFVHKVCPSWGHFSFVKEAKYLGCLIGPLAYLHRWDEAVQKFRTRVEEIRKAGLGLYHSLRLLNSYALAVLAYLCQLYEPPDDVIKDVETQAMRVVKLPGNAISRNLFYCIGKIIPVPSPVLFSTMARATRLRALLATVPTWPKYKIEEPFADNFEFHIHIVNQYRTASFAVLRRSHAEAINDGILKGPHVAEELAKPLSNLVQFKPQQAIYCFLFSDVFFCWSKPLLRLNLLDGTFARVSSTNVLS